jgi:hypothetical protein
MNYSTLLTLILQKQSKRSKQYLQEDSYGWIDVWMYHLERQERSMDAFVVRYRMTKETLINLLENKTKISNSTKGIDPF